MLIGVELDEARVTAVAVDDSGSVRARASRDVNGDDLRAPLSAALEKVRGSTGGDSVGFATPTPDAAHVTAAIAGFPPPVSAATASGTAAAVAESWIGAACGAAHVVFFAIGERTHGGFIRNGVADRGSRGRAGAIAWMSLNPVEREDYRKIGCLEAEVAASGIVRRLIWRVKAGDHSGVLDAVNNDLTAITVGHILDAARGGDGVSTSVVRDTAKYIGMAAANLVVIADPEVLVLGGLMASAPDLLLDPIRVEIARRLPKALLDGLTIVPAALGDDAPAIGAARIGSTRP